MTGLFILAFSIAATSVDGCAMLLGMSASATPYVLGNRGYLCSDTMRGGSCCRGGEGHCARPGKHGGSAESRAGGRLARLLVKEAVLRKDGLTMEIRTEGIEALIKEALDETQN